MTVQRAMAEVQQAVEAIVAKARQRHEGIPDTVIVIGASGATRNGPKHGHFAPKSWKLRGKDEKELYGEILLAGESLERGAEATLGTILHELAHAYCNSHDIKDTSNGNRYHNARFKEVGEEFGLELEKADVIGWSVTTVPKGTAQIYREELDRLDGAIRTHRLSRGDLAALGLDPEKSKAVKRKMQCPECQEPLLVTKKWWEKQGNGGGDYEQGVGLYCGAHDIEYEIYEEVPE